MFDSLRRWFKHETGQDYVTVVEGDSLWRIAKEGVGDGNRWRELAAANPDRKWDDQHTTIHHGEQIKLPESWL
jgi:nucleoid-associated protein YgaU